MEAVKARRAGVAEPVGLYADTHGSGVMSDEKLSKLVLDSFDFTPRGMIKNLKLREPIFRKTASYGHFGRDEPEFTWEATDKAAALAADAK